MFSTCLSVCACVHYLTGLPSTLLRDMNISRASNFRIFSGIAKLNMREFLEWPIAKTLSVQNVDISRM